MNTFQGKSFHSCRAALQAQEGISQYPVFDLGRQLVQNEWQGPFLQKAIAQLMNALSTWPVAFSNRDERVVVNAIGVWGGEVTLFRGLISMEELQLKR